MVLIIARSVTTKLLVSDSMERRSRSYVEGKDRGYVRDKEIDRRLRNCGRDKKKPDMGKFKMVFTGKEAWLVSYNGLIAEVMALRKRVKELEREHR